MHLSLRRRNQGTGVKQGYWTGLQTSLNFRISMLTWNHQIKFSAIESAFPLLQDSLSLKAGGEEKSIVYVLILMLGIMRLNEITAAEEHKAFINNMRCNQITTQRCLSGGFSPGRAKMLPPCSVYLPHIAACSAQTSLQHRTGWSGRSQGREEQNPSRRFFYPSPSGSLFKITIPQCNATGSVCQVSWWSKVSNGPVVGVPLWLFFYLGGFMQSGTGSIQMDWFTQCVPLRRHIVPPFHITLDYFQTKRARHSQMIIKSVYCGKEQILICFFSVWFSKYRKMNLLTALWQKTCVPETTKHALQMELLYNRCGSLWTTSCSAKKPDRSQGDVLSWRGMEGKEI